MGLWLYCLEPRAVRAATLARGFLLGGGLQSQNPDAFCHSSSSHKGNVGALIIGKEFWGFLNIIIVEFIYPKPYKAPILSFLLLSSLLLKH